MLEKLKRKVFITIFFILSIFIVTILGIFNYQNYKIEEDRIKTNFMRADDPPRNDYEKIENGKNNYVNSDTLVSSDGSIENSIGNSYSAQPPQKISDYDMYIINFDTSYNISSINSNSYTQDDDWYDRVSSVTNKILMRKSSNNNIENESIENLYFSSYSYSFKNENTLVILDNTTSKTRLLSLLYTSLSLFFVLEIIALIVSKKITIFVIKPAIDAFEKQNQFVADASHELKTPLAVIVANADALDQEPECKKWLNNIKSEANRMNNLISDMLDMAKIDDEAKKKFSSEDISKNIEMSVLTFESIMYEKKINLSYDIQKDVMLECNVNQIKQLVAILLDNAVKHCSGNEKKINVLLKKDKFNISLYVENTGEDIPVDIQEKIFERFYRADKSRNRDENRYGLGLAIAKNIVENHGGKITVKSSDGVTSFKVLFKH